MNNNRTSLSRRTFLLAATAGTAATAAALVGKKEAPVALANDDSKHPGKGYQLTEHVRNYYRTARI